MVRRKTKTLFKKSRLRLFENKLFYIYNFRNGCIHPVSHFAITTYIFVFFLIYSYKYLRWKLNQVPQMPLLFSGHWWKIQLFRFIDYPNYNRTKWTIFYIISILPS